MGATEVGNLIVRLTGDASNYQKMLDNAAKKAQQGGAAMTKYLTLPLTAIGGIAVREFGKFDQAMTESTSIMSATTEQIERMKKAAKDLARESIHGPDELARAYYYLASAGLDAEQSIAALPTVAAFATAGMFDLSRATDLLTDAQSALGLTSKDVEENMRNMSRVSDVLVKANTLANASVEQFSEALTSKAGAALKTFNKDVEEGVAVLAAMADQGVKGSLAGETLNRVMLMMSKAAIDNADELERLGFKVFDADGKMRNMADIVENLEQVLHGLSDEQKAATLAAMGFKSEIQGAILPLLGTSQSIRRYEQELRNAGGTTKDVAEKQMQSFSNEVKVLWNQIKVAALEIGERLVPTIRRLTNFVAQALEWFGGLSDSTKDWIVHIGVAIAAIGPMILAIGKLIATLAALKVAFAGVSLASMGVAGKAGAFAAASAGAWALGSALREVMPYISKYRDELSDMDRQMGNIEARLNRQRQDAAKAMESGDTEAAERAKSKTKDEIKKYIKEANDAQRELDKARSGFWAFFGVTWNEAKLEALEGRIDKANAARDAALENLKQMEAIINKSADEIAELPIEDAVDQVTLAGTEAYAEEVERLLGDLSKTAVSELDRGLLGATDVLHDMGREVDRMYRVNSDMNPLRAGSPEFERMLADAGHFERSFTAHRTASSGVKDGDPEERTADNTSAILDMLVKFMRESFTRPAASSVL